jgi:hypothetical protein
VAQAVHETLARRGLVTWTPSTIPAGVMHDYVLLTALQLATSFGKQGDPAQRQVIEARVGVSSLVQRAQALAEARVAAIYAGLSGAGMASYGPNAIPASVSEPYVSLLMIDLAPIFGKQADPGRIAQFEGQIRRDALTRRAQGDAVGLVASVHARLVALGIVDWTLQTIPAGVAEDYAELIANDYRPLIRRAAGPHRRADHRGPHPAYGDGLARAGAGRDAGRGGARCAGGAGQRVLAAVGDPAGRGR